MILEHDKDFTVCEIMEDGICECGNPLGEDWCNIDWNTWVCQCNICQRHYSAVMSTMTILISDEEEEI